MPYHPSSNLVYEVVPKERLGVVRASTNAKLKASSIITKYSEARELQEGKLTPV